MFSGHAGVCAEAARGLINTSHWCSWLFLLQLHKFTPLCALDLGAQRGATQCITGCHIQDNHTLCLYIFKLFFQIGPLNFDTIQVLIKFNAHKTISDLELSWSSHTHTESHSEFMVLLDYWCTFVKSLKGQTPTDMDWRRISSSIKKILKRMRSINLDLVVWNTQKFSLASMWTGAPADVCVMLYVTVVCMYMLVQYVDGPLLTAKDCFLLREMIKTNLNPPSTGWEGPKSQQALYRLYNSSGRMCWHC